MKMSQLHRKCIFNKSIKKSGRDLQLARLIFFSKRVNEYSRMILHSIPYRWGSLNDSRYRHRYRARARARGRHVLARLPTRSLLICLY